MVWYSHLSNSFPQFFVIDTVKGFSVVDETEIGIFLKFSCFLYNPVNVGNLISSSFPFLNPVWTSGSSWFTWCWSPVCKILMVLMVILRGFAFPPPVDHVCQNSLLWPVHLGWPCTAWLIALRTYVYPFATTRQWSLKGKPSLTHPLMMLSLFHTVSSVQFSRSVISDSLRPHGLQHARLSCPSPTPGAYSNSCSLNLWCCQPSHPLLSPAPPAFSLSQHQGLFKWVSSLHQVAKVLEFQL